ncbi:MAG: energy transducer TonB [Casimicrobiaceae bacterium]
MNNGAFFPLRDATLTIALVVSTVAHVAVFATLGRIQGDSPPGSRLSGVVVPTLEARLVTLPVADVGGTASGPAPSESGPVPMYAIPNPMADIARVPPAPPAEPPPAAPEAARASTNAGASERDLAAMRMPRIVLDAEIPRTRFGGTFENGALDEFPGEVDARVGVPDRIEIPYPPGALAAGQEATVIGWAVIDPNGAVEAMHVVDGPEEFADTVEKVLARTAFIPARNNGLNIRFYVMFAIDFRIDAGGTVAVDKAATSAR